MKGKPLPRWWQGPAHPALRILYGAVATAGLFVSVYRAVTDSLWYFPISLMFFSVAWAATRRPGP